MNEQYRKRSGYILRIWRQPLIYLLFVAIMLRLIAFFPKWIEDYYATGIYPYLAYLFRIIFGWLPFSFGDILYAIAVILLLINCYKLFKLIKHRQWSKVKTYKIIRKSAVFILSVYIFFNLAWGLNYSRLGIAHQLGLQRTGYTKEDLSQITSLLIIKVNATRTLIRDTVVAGQPYTKVFDKALAAYDGVANQYTFLQYHHQSVKRSSYGRLGNYLGFLGYYNPFTGEAQLNLTQPSFLLPFVSCHEMAHQLGYASESEANFVSYLTTVRSPDVLFKYSAYFEMFSYANRELSKRDSALARANYNRLDTLVKGDFIRLRQYFLQTKNPFEPLIRVFYDNYLKANQQASGVESYNEVVDWLIAYQKKYGHI